MTTNQEEQASPLSNDNLQILLEMEPEQLAELFPAGTDVQQLLNLLHDPQLVQILSSIDTCQDPEKLAQVQLLIGFLNQVQCEDVNSEKAENSGHENSEQDDQVSKLLEILGDQDMFFLNSVESQLLEGKEIAQIPELMAVLKKGQRKQARSKKRKTAPSIQQNVTKLDASMLNEIEQIYNFLQVLDPAQQQELSSVLLSQGHDINQVNELVGFLQTPPAHADNNQQIIRLQQLFNNPEQSEIYQEIAEPVPEEVSQQNQEEIPDSQLIQDIQKIVAMGLADHLPPNYQELLDLVTQNS
jgi:hypothetical protein